MKKAVVTLILNFGTSDVFRMARYTHPTMLAYARRIGADFHLLTKRRWPDRHLFFEKFQLVELFDQGYDRVFYVDSDALIRGDAPNVFDVVPPGRFGAVNETPFWSDATRRQIHVVMAKKDSILPNWTWDGVYLNAGVFVIDRVTAPLLTKPTETEAHLPFGDQGMLNLLHQFRKLNYFELDKAWNFMPFMHPSLSIEEICRKAYIIHVSVFPLEHRLHLMQQVIRHWNNTYRGDAHGQ